MYTYMLLVNVFFSCFFFHSSSVMNTIKKLDLSWCQSKWLLKRRSFNKSTNKNWVCLQNSVRLYVKRKYPINPEEAEKLPGNIHVLQWKQFKRWGFRCYSGDVMCCWVSVPAFWGTVVPILSRVEDSVKALHSLQMLWDTDPVTHHRWLNPR